MRLVTTFTTIVIALILMALVASGFLLWRRDEVNARCDAMIDHEVAAAAAALPSAHQLSALVATLQERVAAFRRSGARLQRQRWATLASG
jgi:UDP-N-acetylmuramyl pentapeptide synthase